jgi:hypothetical protein
VQSPTCFDREPFVLFAPQNQHWNIDFVVPFFDLVGVPLAVLSDLSIERGLSHLTDPRLDARVDLVVARLSIERTSNVFP